MFEEMNLKSPLNTDDWRIDSRSFEFKNISEMDFNKTYVVCGVYMCVDCGLIRAHGIMSVIDLDSSTGYRVNLPTRYNSMVKQITSASKYKDGINNEKCGVTFESVVTKRGNQCYNVKLIDL